MRVLVKQRHASPGNDTVQTVENTQVLKAGVQLYLTGVQDGNVKDVQNF